MDVNTMDIIKEGMTIDEIREKYAEMSKIYRRMARHGENVVNKAGRKPVSPEHKKEVYKKWLEKKKQEKIEQALAEGRVYRVGRPSKINVVGYSSTI